MSKYSPTWSLIKTSWFILKQDKGLLIFPFLSGLCCLLVVVLSSLPLLGNNNTSLPVKDESSIGFFVYCLILFLIYFCIHFIITFFNSAVVAYAARRIQGEDITVREGFLVALDCISLIAGWALLAATVGVILDIIEDRLGRFARIIVSMVGISWAAVSFLVVPVMVIERKHAISATKESAQLIEKTWGEGLLSNFYFFRVFFYFSLPGVLLFILGFLISTDAAVGICISLAAIYIVMLMIVQSTLKSIFQTALYFYACDNLISEGFRRGDLRRAFTKKGL